MQHMLRRDQTAGDRDSRKVRSVQASRQSTSYQSLSGQPAYMRDPADLFRSLGERAESHRRVPRVSSFHVTFEDALRLPLLLLRLDECEQVAGSDGVCFHGSDFDESATDGSGHVERDWAGEDFDESVSFEHIFALVGKPE